MGKHSVPDPGKAAGDGSGSAPDDGWQGRRRRTDGGRRGISPGAIAAIATVVVLVAGIIVWQFFGDALSRRSSDAAQQCLAGTATVAVVADSSIAEIVRDFAEQYTAEATPVGDTCIEVAVTEADSDPVVSGLGGSWPGDLGDIPALWVPASSIPVARLQATVGRQIVSDARSLVMSPVVLAVRPQLEAVLGEEGWAALPGLQTDPTALDALGLTGWGSLRLVLPVAGAADAGYLAAEAVAATSAPPGSPATAGLAAATTLLAAAPRPSGDSAEDAWKALVDGDPATGAVHAVAITEQQLFARTTGLDNAKDVVAGWIPGGPAAVADYPTVLLDGPWLTEEQAAGASEFARFMRKPDQLAKLAEAGFRADGTEPKGNDVVGFAPLAEPLPTADDQIRAAIAGTVVPAGVATTTVMVNQNLDGVGPPLANRVAALPPASAVGLWTFNGTDSSTAVPTGPLGEPLGDEPRSAVVSGALEGLSPTDSGAVSFTTLRLVYSDALANYRPGQPNSVLVITQGPHTDRTLDGPGLEEFVKSAGDPARPVRINVIDLAGDPDRPTWESVAQLSGGTYLEVPGLDSPELVSAISRLLS